MSVNMSARITSRWKTSNHIHITVNIIIRLFLYFREFSFFSWQLLFLCFLCFCFFFARGSELGWCLYSKFWSWWWSRGQLFVMMSVATSSYSSHIGNYCFNCEVFFRFSKKRKQWSMLSFYNIALHFEWKCKSS